MLLAILRMCTRDPWDGVSPQNEGTLRIERAQSDSTDLPREA